MSENPYANPQVTELPPSQKGNAIGLVLKIVLGLFGVVLLLGLFSPMVRTARPAAYRMACSNNLKQISLALHNYQSQYGSFPPAFTADAEGQTLHSWRTLILPYMEQNALYEQIDLSKPWNDPVNQAPFETALPVYACPQTSVGGNGTTYFAYVGEHSCIQIGGTTQNEYEVAIALNGVCVLELDQSEAVPWMQPIDVNRGKMVDFLSADKLPHQNGITVALADGSVQFVLAGLGKMGFFDLTGENRNKMFEKGKDEQATDKESDVNSQ